MNSSEWGHFAGGTVHIICSSHNDIAWFDTPAATIAWRDEKSITPALDRMETNPNVHFAMENVLYLLEYLERHPERKQEIRQLALDQRFDWGATYNQPYESLLSGEQLVREVYFGRRLVKKLLPGVDARVYYSPDVPGRAMQMPQILAKAGIPYMVISRHKPGLQYWYSPDGSRVLSWSMGHYAETCLFKKQIEGDPQRVVQNVLTDLQHWDEPYRQRGIPPHYAYIWSMDYIPPKDFDDLIYAWAQRRTASPDMPHLQYSTPEQFLDAVAVASPDLEVVCGERPNVWLYIHGPTHHRAITAKRAAGILLPAAEMFATIDAALTGDFSRYPKHLLDRAWSNAIYDDHGWGGNNGHITDEVFRQKLQTASDIGSRLLDTALTAIAQRVQTDTASGIPLVVFNALSWQRTDPVRCAVPALYGPFHIVDSDHKPIAHQLISPTTGVDTEIVFIAPDVPSVGYRTFYLVPGVAPSVEPVQVTDRSFENRYYRATLAPGGIKSLWDKELQQEVLRTDKFLGAEIIMLESVGNGAGEFGSVQQPSAAADYERASEHQPAWQITETGSIYTTYTLTQQLRYCLLVQRLIFFHEIKRVDCEISLFNWTATKSREFRLMLPVHLRDAQIAYEVPMGVVEVGKSEIKGAATDGPVYSGYSEETGGYTLGPAYLDECKDVHPREVQNFISAAGSSLAVTLSSSVAVCDWIDPTPSPVPYPILQPILLASRKSCHSKGNWYLQGGEHHYRFSILSHRPGWQNGSRFGVQANNPLYAVVKSLETGPGSLPPESGFLSVSADNVWLSALKKAEDDSSVVVRCYEVEGQDSDCAIRLAFPVTQAFHTNIIEEDGQPLAVHNQTLNIRVGHHAIETFKLMVGV